MDYSIIFSLIFPLVSVVLSFVLEREKKKHEIDFKVLFNEFEKKIMQIEDITNLERTKTIIMNYCFNESTNMVDIRLYNMRKSKFQMYLVARYSTQYFLSVYQNNDILSSIKIKNKNYFEDVAKYCISSSIFAEYTQKEYDIDRNVDLINVCRKSYKKLIISNVKDFQDSEYFFNLQNKSIENKCNAIIAIPIFNENGEVIACFTVYFNKPLDDKIKLKTIKSALNIIKNKLNMYVEEYYRCKLSEINENIVYNDSDVSI